MGIYIAESMPDRCRDCPCAAKEYGIWDCSLLKLMLTHDEVYVKRRPDCPLIDVPKHGDLIDRDVLREFQMEQKLSNGRHLRCVSMPIVEQLKAVIPADCGGEQWPVFIFKG